MSLYFTFDYNLNKIEKASKIAGLKTDRYYRIYGLRQDDNPTVLIEYKTLPEGKNENDIRKLLRRNGMNVAFVISKFNVQSIEIGIRKDVREHVFLAAAMVNAVVGYLENKVNLDSDFSRIGFKRIYEDEEADMDKIFKK